MKLKLLLKSLFLILIFLIILLFFIRLFSSRYLDDLHPNIPCDADLIEKSDYLAVIPLYNNQNISESKEWCSYISSFNKTILMHGVFHTYQEFAEARNSSYILEGVSILALCFNYSSLEFKPPQLALSSENRKLLKKDFNFKLHTKYSAIFHKSYHCNDSGILSNRIVDWV
ncbi:hypothetical protein HYW76_03485 [Candidatus Pacearchaeota archaeon]|nr:hypothetical protein [Candidatus Pacearchaeota archaeon]